MLKQDKFNRSSIFRSKYMELDIENMPDEEFRKISRKVYFAIIVRSCSGVFLFILCIIALVLGGKYAW